MNEITKESFTFHLGVALATECVQSFSAMAPGGSDSFLGGAGGGSGSFSSAASRQPLQIGSKADSSRFMISMSNRQSYTSQVQAMLTLYPSADQRKVLTKEIVGALDRAARGVREAAKKEEEAQV